MDDLMRIRALLIFLRTGKPTLDEIMRFISHNTLFEFAVVGAHLNVIYPDGTIHITNGYGCDPELLSLIPVRHISVESPFNRYLRIGEIGQCGGIDEFTFSGPDYAQKIFPNGFESSFLVPIQGVGSVATFCSNAIKMTIEQEEFLMVIGDILSFEICKVRGLNLDVDKSSRSDRVANYSLTSRQWEVVAGIRAGKTNAEISVELGFSESLVRQETVQIYKKLGVSGRKEIHTLDLITSNGIFEV